ncbi:30S ribosomal protein S20 [bacterium]|nr:30S ribosomal protein S20 [bacterium]
MAHHKSTKKRIKTNLKANLRNRQYRSKMRTAMRKVREATDVDTAHNDLQKTNALFDRLVVKGIIHRNTAARRKSRLHKAVENRFAITESSESVS